MVLVSPEGDTVIGAMTRFDLSEQTHCNVACQRALVFEYLLTLADDKLRAQKKKLRLLCGKSIPQSFGQQPFRKRARGHRRRVSQRLFGVQHGQNVDHSTSPVVS